ncbi:MAG: hypothetical protein HQL20_08660 [Candidatus Omnitrophica bacterium]|nr:hypothetical protein [Candidatus Omnitrophota bacterium]
MRKIIFGILIFFMAVTGYAQQNSDKFGIEMEKSQIPSQFENDPEKRITAIGELVAEEGGDKIHFAKYRILEVKKGKIDSDVITIGYYFYTLKGALPHKALLYLKKYEGKTELKHYYVAIDYNAETSILDYDHLSHIKSMK